LAKRKHEQGTPRQRGEKVTIRSASWGGKVRTEQGGKMTLDREKKTTGEKKGKGIGIAKAETEPSPLEKVEVKRGGN